MLAALAHQQRLAGFNTQQRDEEETEPVVDALPPGLEQAAGRAALGRLVEGHDARSDAGDQKHRRGLTRVGVLG